MKKENFENMLSGAEQNEQVMNQLMSYLFSFSYELYKVISDLYDYMDDEVEEDHRQHIKNTLSAYIDFDDEDSIYEAIEDCERVMDNCIEEMDCISKRCFSFEDWGYNSDVEWGDNQFCLDYEYDELNGELIISPWFLTKLGWHLDDEVIKTLKIKLLSANYTDVA